MTLFRLPLLCNKQPLIGTYTGLLLPLLVPWGQAGLSQEFLYSILHTVAVNVSWCRDHLKGLRG